MGNEKSLVIVESPSKAKTISKFLGGKYKVVASVGHVRDLPKSKLGIDIDRNFEPEYISIRGKGDVIKAMKKEAKSADKIYLATDPDREGEAISWHIAHLLDLDRNEANRIVFNEITKDAIKGAVKNPRPIDQNLVDAQQARRVLDRLVGYQISPLLWRKIRRGLSAGRVQSAALKIICDREKEIRSFIPKEYWNISAVLKSAGGGKESKPFTARLTEHKGKKISVDDRTAADAIVAALAPNAYAVKRVERKERVRKPFAPFTTSSLQQEASSKLGFYTKKVMFVAQQLYEGVEIKGKGAVGLVSYIRTDSVRISAEAHAAVTNYITSNFPEGYLGNNVYSNKKKDVQDAHEAIRPTYVELHPSDIKDSLTKDQYALYRLIWARFVASRMAPAVYDSEAVDIANGDYGFRANGSVLKFDGFLRVYDGAAAAAGDENEEKRLPPLSEGEPLTLVDLLSEQNFTQPPSRFTEAGLVKDLEEKNIGRPSTYVPIIATLTEKRKYITREKKTLCPTELGFVVTELMETYFKEIVDTGFTAGMEDKLDDIEVKNTDWKAIVGEFYDILKDELRTADAEIEKVKLEDEVTDEICELCGRHLVKKFGRFGEFLACSGYPECKNTKPIVNKIDVKCPQCGRDIVARKSKKGRVFYGCSGYPECNRIFWNKPVEKQCPHCGSLMTEKKTKSSNLLCSNAECGYKE
ncbi:MAG: type I DNA topoisomerase [Clostridiales Family XIII bacterium]|jgi:DNA topoisomerase-1|nr:type I DNA topoisomerase [Clostridiales Family XIII bacterium]